MNDCIFCKIVENQIPSQNVYEDETVLAFRDISPQAPVHILIIPKKHIADMNAVQPSDWLIIGDIHRAAQKIAQEQGIASSGYRLINNCGKDSGQLVFHIHYHLVGGEDLGPLLTRG